MSAVFHLKRMIELLVFVLLNFVFSGECSPRSFYHPAMCEREGSIDCSFQMTDRKSGSCKVYNTAECQDFDLHSWTRQSSKHPAVQSDSLCTVDVFPYALTDVRAMSQLYAAINITVTTSNKDINGYVLVLSSSDVKMNNICRIFDFRTSGIKNHKTLFYDCLYNLIAKGTQNFELRVTILPHNEEILYTLFLPDVQNIETNNVCQWKPLVMVFNGGLQNNIVEVKFSQVPKHLNISSYEVSLLPKMSDTAVQKVMVEAAGDALLNATFSHVDRGFYSISIKPLSSTSTHRCETMAYTLFFIENKIIDKVIISYILAVCFAGVIVVIAVLLLLWWLFKPGYVTIGPVSVMLVYSYDYKEHNRTVLRYAKFLENQGGMKVSTIYGEQRSDPEMWLFNPYRNCDVVIIILSEGVFNKCENGSKSAMEEDYPCGDRLIPAMSFLKTKMLTDEKNFIQVYFEYSGTCNVPSFLQSGNWEKPFAIPREMNRLLCRVYNQSPKIACLGVYPRMPGHDVVSSPEGSALIDSIEEMKQFLNENRVLQTWNEFTLTEPKIGYERDTLPVAKQDRLRSTDFSEARLPKNSQMNKVAKCNEYNPNLNISSKQLCSNYCYSNEHNNISDEENCAHLCLLQDCEHPIAECEPNHKVGGEGLQRSSFSNASHDIEIGADQHLKDLEYIFSKPGPLHTRPYLDRLKTSK